MSKHVQSRTRFFVNKLCATDLSISPGEYSKQYSEHDVHIEMRAGSRGNLNTAVTSGWKRSEIVGLLARSATVEWYK